jgi:arginase family enzyme
MISVSIDLGAGRRGVDMGPSALRIAGITQAVEGLGYAVREVGTVTAGGFETTDPGGESRTHGALVSSSRRGSKPGAFRSSWEETIRCRSEP